MSKTRKVVIAVVIAFIIVFSGGYAFYEALQPTPTPTPSVTQKNYHLKIGEPLYSYYSSSKPFICMTKKLYIPKQEVTLEPHTMKSIVFITQFNNFTEQSTWLWDQGYRPIQAVNKDAVLQIRCDKAAYVTLLDDYGVVGTVNTRGSITIPPQRFRYDGLEYFGFILANNEDITVTVTLSEAQAEETLWYAYNDYEVQTVHQV